MNMQLAHHLARQNGATFVSVKAHDGRPAHTYSIGFFRTFGWPELICIGPRYPIGGALLAVTATFLERGKVDPFTLCRLSPRLEVCLLQPEMAQVEDWMSWGVKFYRNKPFPALQVVMPDDAGRFPWNAGYDGNYDVLLGPAPVLPSRRAA
jgi:hypothetical protein